MGNGLGEHLIRKRADNKQVVYSIGVGSGGSWLHVSAMSLAHADMVKIFRRHEKLTKTLTDESAKRLQSITASFQSQLDKMEQRMIKNFGGKGTGQPHERAAPYGGQRTMKNYEKK